MKQGPLTLVLLALIGAAPATQPLPPVTINRSDVYDAAMRVEDAYLAKPPQPGETRARVHRAFDEAAYLHITSRAAESIERFNLISDFLDPPANQGVRSLVRSLQVRVSPQIGWRNRPGIMRIRIARMYRVDTALPMDLRLAIRADTPQKQVVLDVPVKIEDSGPPFSLTQAGPEAPMGKYLIEMVGPDGSRHPIGRWTVTEVSLDVIRNAVAQQMVGFRPEAPDMIQGLVALGARSALLTDRPDLNNPSQFLVDPLDFLRDVQSETENFAMGKNPYTDRVGDWWRAVPAGAMQIPARIYAPEKAKTRQPMPLVIALQGSGWDENLFFEAAGRGRIKKLADEYGFVVISPNTFWLRNNLAALDGMIDSMALAYAIDKSRVFVIGHSSGAAQASEMVGRSAHKVAAMTLFAGGDFSNVAALPRTLLYSGGVDPFYPKTQAQSAVAAAKTTGLPVELRIVEDAGHLLIANDKLDEAVKWMLDGPAANK